MEYTYPYPRPMVTTDCVTLKMHNRKLYIALIQRAKEPFKDFWALPGGFLEMDEIAQTGALRELEEETGIISNYAIASHFVDDVNRDPRGRVISLIYYTIVKEETQIMAADDAKDGKWFYIEDLPALACDHQKIITKVMNDIHKDIIIKTDNYKVIIDNNSFVDINNLQTCVKSYLDNN